ncbi:MAG: LysE family transporter, partial [Pseudomonadota bacterium]
MTLTIGQMALYSGALLILFLTPGPVWLALVARSMSGGFSAAWPLALGVAVGDMVWPLLAVVGVSWIVSEFDGFLILLRWVACAVFLFMGWSVIRHADAGISENKSLT